MRYIIIGPAIGIKIENREAYEAISIWFRFNELELGLLQKQGVKMKQGF